MDCVSLFHTGWLVGWLVVFARSFRDDVVSSEFPVLSVPTGMLRIILSVPPELRVPGAVI